MKTIYIYVLDTLADWELGYVTAELNSRRFFKKDAPLLMIKTVGYSKKAIKTMGGMKIVPDCLVEDVEINDGNVLLLPGADTWSKLQNAAVIEKAKALLAAGGIVGAICGATVALADFGLLDNWLHTSNGLEFLEMVSVNYRGEKYYRDQCSVSNNNLITAGSAGALMWTKQIMESLEVFKKDTLDFWYAYFSTGNTKFFFKLMKTLPAE
ncbi:DJ-1/PfpI family protein [Liquorilactobacillus satsumensis]|uniref:DJ-1/PfpI family protein n=1 Tax=Liquorilactobacillus TaxID=2767888 RepID=UPI001E355DC6|nr:DJ-1/PfpI family protein [Liquorilactobacillus satsumensis]MCC7667700.1 glutamine amidotransferase [Liquorilactobacillus satsumensis]MCP9358784.1 DJ-1/PfpI family protein [Liquorilactobacillus satsumensis]MCP9372724.1 DJ-1/PfpI family protein [Liquorilactobacillus satsumensis]